MFKKRYWVYEVDTFMVGFYQNKPDIEPKKKFLFKFMAKAYQSKIANKMRTHLGASSSYLKYNILKANFNETFEQAYERINGGKL